jgi:hypothetical protein
MEIGFEPRSHAVDAIILHLASRYLRDALFTEERQEVDTEPDLMAFRPLLALLAFCDDLILKQELLGGLSRALLR